MLQAIVDKNAAQQGGVTPVYIAAQEGHKAIVSALLAAGADKNAAIKDGATPLFVAAQQGHEAAVSALLAADADMNATPQEQRHARISW